MALRLAGAWASRSCQIVVCNFTVLRDNPDFLNFCFLANRKWHDILSESICVIFVELTKLKEIRRKPVGEPAKAETWALFFKHASNPRHRKLINKFMEHKEEIDVAMGLLSGISKDAREREEFCVRLKNRMSIRDARASSTALAVRPAQTDLKVAKEVGEARGGRKRDKINKLEFAKKLLAIPLPLETTADCAGLPLEVVKFMASSHQKRLTRRLSWSSRSLARPSRRSYSRLEMKAS
jgi:hypothetical protein